MFLYFFWCTTEWKAYKLLMAGYATTKKMNGSVMYTITTSSWTMLWFLLGVMMELSTKIIYKPKGPVVPESSTASLQNGWCYKLGDGVTTCRGNW